MQATRLAAGVFALVLATGAAVAGAIALAGHASRAAVVAAAVAGLAGWQSAGGCAVICVRSAAILHATGGGCSWPSWWAVFSSQRRTECNSPR
jgi:hypothetical protein